MRANFKVQLPGKKSFSKGHDLYIQTNFFNNEKKSIQINNINTNFVAFLLQVRGMAKTKISGSFVKRNFV